MRWWNVARIGITASLIIELENAWEQADDDPVLEALRNWRSTHDPYLDDLILVLADEDEQRAWRIYRQWVWENLHVNRYWRHEKVAQAREMVTYYESPRRDFEGVSPSMRRIGDLAEKRWKIITEEAEAYWALVGDEENAFQLQIRGLIQARPDRS